MALKIGTKYFNNGSSYKIIEIKEKTLIIEFEKTGSKKEIKKVNVNYNVKDFYEPKIYGVGFFGIGKFSQKENSNIYDCWRNMLRRCYDEKSEKFKSYGAKGVTVCKRWHNFQLFAEDTTKMKNSYKKGYQLDKDFDNNKEYNELCSFIPEKENLMKSVEKRKRKIKAINIKTKEEKIFNSITEAALELKTTTGNIVNVLNKKRKSAMEHDFEYLI